MNCSWESFFPYDTPREDQTTAINSAIKYFESGKKFVIIEAGTGVGKSAIGYTLSKYLNSKEQEDGFEPGGLFLTTQKILQDQYTRDFNNLGMKSIKSSSNYTCSFHRENNCAQGLRVLKTARKGSKQWNTCVHKCPYRNEKKSFVESSLSVTNFPYFLAETQYSGKIKPRNVLVLDEAHNLASELSKFIEIAVTEKFCSDFLKLKIPEFSTQNKCYKWLKEIYYEKANSRFSHMKQTIEKFAIEKDDSRFVKIAKQYELLDKHLCKLRRFFDVYDKDNWIFNDIPRENRKSRRLEFKPIDVSSFSNEMVFDYGNKVVIMSATILNKDAFCEMLGIKSNDAEFISLPSPFPIKNRPILFFPVGKMSYSHIDSSLPKLIEAVKKIMENHKKEKGIIHCHTFRIANFIKKNIRSKRILIHNSENRQEMLNKHIKSKTPTVLLSPSMTEGVDLSGDASRFQILCKVPYPFLGDKLVKKKMHKWEWWYPMHTCKTIIQSVGRSVRNNEDHAVTYILDSDWEYFYKKNGNSFPKDFRQCLL